MLSMLQRVRGAMPKWQPAYESLVIDVADGKSVPDNLEDVLAGRTAEDFSADVRQLIARREAVTTLNTATDLKDRVAAAARAVEEAKQALANDPLAKMIDEFERKKAAVLDAQVAASAANSAFTGPQSQARNLLHRTSSKKIDGELAELSGSSATLQRERDQVALSSAEVKARAEMETDLATLPARIAKADIAEAAGLTARLVLIRTTLKDFAARQKEVDRIDREIEKLAKSREKIEGKRMIAENMEFKSQPRSREL